MQTRRILSLWFPRLGAERWLRQEAHLSGKPVVTVVTAGNAQTLGTMNLIASMQGLYPGQPLRDAHAICAGLVTRPADPSREMAFLEALHRWAGKFSPWVSAHPPDSLVVDLTGCAHLFGGEDALCRQIALDCDDLGLTVRSGLADTLGAAWALARFTSSDRQYARSGDAIEQEAPATRAKAGKRRHWERGGAAPIQVPGGRSRDHIAPPGAATRLLAPLPIAALRLPAETQEALTRVGLRSIGDLMAQPRATLARRFGHEVLARLDQATGNVPEPIGPAAAPDRFAVRISFPEPIGLQEDVADGFARLLDRLCTGLRAKGQGVRVLRLEAHRCDHIMQWQTVVLADALMQPERIMPLVRMKIAEMEAGPGIDMLRMEALRTEAVRARTMAGHVEAATQGESRRGTLRGLDDLVGRLGARLGTEAVTRYHPANSHVPDKMWNVVAATWTDPAMIWPVDDRPRPLLMWPPEAVMAPDRPDLAPEFRWRGRDWKAVMARGPERIMPEWWLEDAAWRSGPRDYWDVCTAQGDRLWLFYAYGGAVSSGWFCHGSFA